MLLIKFLNCKLFLHFTSTFFLYCCCEITFFFQKLCFLNQKLRYGKIMILIALLCFNVYHFLFVFLCFSIVWIYYYYTMFAMDKEMDLTVRYIYSFHMLAFDNRLNRYNSTIYCSQLLCSVFVFVQRFSLLIWVNPKIRFSCMQMDFLN